MLLIVSASAVSMSCLSPERLCRGCGLGACYSNSRREDFVACNHNLAHISGRMTHSSRKKEKKMQSRRGEDDADDEMG